MKEDLSTEEFEIKKNLLNLMNMSKEIMYKHPLQNKIRLEFSGLMHDLRYIIELVDHFFPLDNFGKKFMKESNQSLEVAEIFVSRTDRNIRKSFLTMTLFSLETILKIIANNHKIKIPRSETVCKYIIVMKYFDVYSEANENLVRILHYTRNTLHNGERVDKEAHLYYCGTDYDFVRKKPIVSTFWNHLTFLIQELLNIFKQITESPKYVIK